jgi:hypothetical protein
MSLRLSSIPFQIQAYWLRQMLHPRQQIGTSVSTVLHAITRRLMVLTGLDILNKFTMGAKMSFQLNASLIAVLCAKCNVSVYRIGAKEYTLWSKGVHPLEQRSTLFGAKEYTLWSKGVHPLEQSLLLHHSCRYLSSIKD